MRGLTTLAPSTCGRSKLKSVSCFFSIDEQYTTSTISVFHSFLDRYNNSGVILSGVLEEDWYMHGGLGVDAVTDRDNSVEVVVVGIVNLPVGGSYPEFPDNCRLTQLLSFKDILEVLVHGTDIYPKSSRNLRLCCLYRLVLQIAT